MASSPLGGSAMGLESSSTNAYVEDLARLAIYKSDCSTEYAACE